jgi:rubrerythrin
MTQESKIATPGQRRVLLKQASLMTVGIATALGILRSSPALAAAKPGARSKELAEDIAILNTALAAEHQGIAAYQVGAESGRLQKAVLDTAIKFQTHHRAHAGLLQDTILKLGGTPVAAKKAAEYGFPVERLKTQADVLRFAAGLEQGAASAYLGAVPAFHTRDLAKAAASILGDESMHWAILLHVLGEDPVPVAFIS